METNFTYTLADIGKANFKGTPLAVIGHPIRHSISPAMHNAAISKMAVQNSRFRDWAYYRFDIAPEDFSKAISLFYENSFLGINVTVPFKVQVMDMVQGLSPEAELMGAVNTLFWGEHGYLGFNTDGYGLKKGLKDDLGITLKGTTIILLGSGGVARSAAVQCLNEGCDKLHIGNRSVERLNKIMSLLKNLPNGERVEAFTLSKVPVITAESGVLINATSLGLNSSDPSPFDVSNLPQNWVVYDMIYNPLTTRLVQDARDRGLSAANGLSMLVHQGARSLEIWSHASVDATTMMRAACHALDLPPRNY